MGGDNRKEVASQNEFSATRSTEEELQLLYIAFRFVCSSIFRCFSSRNINMNDTLDEIFVLCMSLNINVLETVDNILMEFLESSSRRESVCACN